MKVRIIGIIAALGVALGGAALAEAATPHHTAYHVYYVHSLPHSDSGAVPVLIQPDYTPHFSHPAW